MPVTFSISISQNIIQIYVRIEFRFNLSIELELEQKISIRMQYHNPYQSQSASSLHPNKYQSSSYHSTNKLSSPSHNHTLSHHTHPYQDLSQSNYSKISSSKYQSKQNSDYHKTLQRNSPLRSGDQWNSRGLKEYNLEIESGEYRRKRGDVSQGNRNSRNITVEDEMVKSKAYAKGYDLSVSQNLNLNPKKSQRNGGNMGSYLSNKDITSVERSQDTFNSPFKKKVEIEQKYGGGYEKEYSQGSRIRENEKSRGKVMEKYRDYVGSKSSKQLEMYPSYYQKDGYEKEKENKKEYLHPDYNGHDSKYNTKFEQGLSSKYDTRYQNSQYQKSRFNPTSSTYKDLNHTDHTTSKYHNNEKSRSKGNSYHQYPQSPSFPSHQDYNKRQQKRYSKGKDSTFQDTMKSLQKSRFDPNTHTPKSKPAFTTPALPSVKSYADLTQFQTSPKLTSIKQFKSTSLLPQKHQTPTIADFHLGKSKGEGKFGTVFCAFHKATGSVYALKRISKEMIKNHNMISQLALQIKLQLYFNHPNILKLYGFFDDKQHIYLILQYMEQGTLFQSLKKRIERIPEKQVIKRIREMSSAIKYLHEIDVAHRDIKPENIVISHGVSKLCDFGWATICNGRRTTYCGTFDYAAPEILEGKEYDWCVDLWCLGVLTYELLVGKVPFYHISRKETMKKILRVDRDQLVFPADVSWKAKDFIESLIKKDPEERMLGDKLLEHAFLKAGEGEGRV